MVNIGYVLRSAHKTDINIWLKFTEFNGNDAFSLCYVTAPMSPEAIKISFESHKGEPILFVVDSILVNNVTELWFRALHAIYYGRVYLWDGDGIVSWHYDWNKKQSSYSDYLDLDGILFTDTDCKLRDFPGIFHIARFYDKSFWKETEPQKPKGETWKERAKKGREEWEQATKGHAQGHNNPNYSQKESDWADDFKYDRSRKSEENIYEAFARAFREHMRSHGVDYDTPRTRNNSPVGDKWLQGFINTGNIEAAKTLYRQLSKQYHPDLNPGDTVAEETFKAISVAFSKARDILR